MGMKVTEYRVPKKANVSFLIVSKGLALLRQRRTTDSDTHIYTVNPISFQIIKIGAFRTLYINYKTIKQKVVLWKQLWTLPVALEIIGQNSP